MALVKYNNNSISSVTALDSMASGSMVLLNTNTISSGVSSSSFTSNINSTYDTYIFKFINIHPATNASGFQFNASADGGSNFNTTLTNTYFLARHQEDGSSTSLAYSADDDQAQGTSFQRLNESTGSDNDQSVSGHMHLFEPSSTVFVKHYISRTVSIFDRATDVFGAGYFNTTSAITGIQFKMSSGNIDSGTITMYGVT